MATRDVFSEDELARLRGFPEPARAELIRYFTLAPADEAFARRFRGQDNVMGVAVQLCTLPWLGFVPDDVAAAPAAAPAAVVARLSEKLGIPVGALRGYGAREQTRTGHLREVAGYLGWRTVDGPRWKDLEEFLFARAMEHDSPKLLLRQACEYLSSSMLVRPGIVKILERVATVRERAREETWVRVAPLLTLRRQAELDKMLAVDPTLGRTRLSWLGTGPVAATPAAVKGELEKLAYLRGLDADTLDLSVLPTERRRFLAGVGRRLTPQHLARREPARRYPILLTLITQSAVDVLDESLLLFDQALSGRESAARARLTEVLAERGRGGENRQALLDDILKIVLDPEIGDDQVGARLRGGYRPRADAGGVGGPPRAAAPRSRAPGDDGRLHGLPAPVRPRCAGRRPVRRRPWHGRPAPGRHHPGRAVRNQGPQGPRRRPRRVRARPLGRLPREGREGRRRHRLPALLGAVRADGPARRAALGRRLCLRVAPVRRPCLVPSHPAAVGAAAAGVLPRGRQAGVRGRRPRPGR